GCFGAGNRISREDGRVWFYGGGQSTEAEHHGRSASGDSTANVRHSQSFFSRGRQHFVEIASLACISPRVLLCFAQLRDIGWWIDDAAEQLFPLDESGELLLLISELVVYPVHPGLLVRDDELRIEYRDLGFREIGPDSSPDVVDLPRSDVEAL